MRIAHLCINNNPVEIHLNNPTSFELWVSNAFYLWFQLLTMRWMTTFEDLMEKAFIGYRILWVVFSDQGVLIQFIEIFPCGDPAFIIEDLFSWNLFKLLCNILITISGHLVSQSGFSSFGEAIVGECKNSQRIIIVRGLCSFNR